MNNKGFTLIEMVLAITIVSLIFTIVIVSINGAFGLTNEKSYEVMKKSIVTSVYDYVYECDNGLIDCDNDYIWKENENIKETSFLLNVLKRYSYLSTQQFINPLTDEDVSDCMIINVTKDKSSNIDVELDDSKCLK